MATQEVTSRAKQRVWRAVRFCIKAVATLFCLLLLALVTARYWLPWVFETRFRISQGERVVRALQQGRIRPNAYGQVSLPPSLAYGQRPNRVYYTAYGDGLKLVFFPTYHARDLHGYIWSSLPLTKSHIEPGIDGVPSIRLNTFTAVPGDTVNLSAMPLTRRISPHWYYTADNATVD